MRHLVALVLLMACGENGKPISEGPGVRDAPGPNPPADEPPGETEETGDGPVTDTAQDVPVDTGPADGHVDEPSSTLERIAAGSLGVPAGAVTTSWSNPINGYVYFLNGADRTVYYLNEARIHPTEDWCISPVCERSGTFTSGRLQAPYPGLGMCADLTRGQLYLTQVDADVRVVDIDPSGELAESYHRLGASVQLPPVVLDHASMDGGCAYIDALDALLIADAQTGLTALVDVETGGLRTVAAEALRADRWIPLEDGQRVVASVPDEQALAVVSLPDLSVHWLDVGAPVLDISLDESGQQLYIAHGESPGISVLSLSDPSLPIEAIPDAPDAQSVAISPDGSVLASVDVGTVGEPSAEIILLEDDQVVDRATLHEMVLDIVEPFAGGDFTVVVEDWAGQLGFVSYDVQGPTESDDRPPLNLFVMAAIEQPSDADLALLRKGTMSCSVVHEYVDQIRGNAMKLSDLDIGLAVAVTTNFAEAAALCDRLSVFDMLQEQGLNLGYMVHRKPTYHCTDVSSPTGADVCSRFDDNYCSPETEDCSFPGSLDYCGLGDQECYQRSIDETSVYTESLFGIKPAFVVGADRHGIWGWDWLAGYQSMLHRDGTRGYDTTGFAHIWSYADQVTFYDTRGKNDGPWDGYRRSEAWAMGYVESWDVHSAFSELVYMPGVTTSLIKLGERYSTGLNVIDLLNTDVTFGYGDDDFSTLWQLLRNAVEHRGNVGPNVWYFHLHDLTTQNLVDASGEVMPMYDKLETWVDDVNRQYVEPGEARWSNPVQVRREWSETR